MAIISNVASIASLAEFIAETGEFATVWEAVQAGVITEAGTGIYVVIEGGAGTAISTTVGSALDVASMGGLTASATNVGTAGLTLAQSSQGFSLVAMGSMPMSAVAAAVAPFAGAAIGANLYEANPSLWTKLSQKLLPFCYPGTTDIPTWAAIAQSTQLYKMLVRAGIIDAVKEVFEEVGFGQPEIDWKNLNGAYCGLTTLTTSTGVGSDAGGAYTYEFVPDGEIPVYSYMEGAAQIIFGFSYTAVSTTYRFIKHYANTTETYVTDVVYQQSSVVVDGVRYRFYRGPQFSSTAWPNTPVTTEYGTDAEKILVAGQPAGSTGGDIAGVTRWEGPIAPPVPETIPIIIVPEPLGPDYQPITEPTIPISPPAVPILPPHVDPIPLPPAPDPETEPPPDNWPEEEPWPTTIPFPWLPPDTSPDPEKWPPVIPWPLPQREPSEWPKTPEIPTEWPEPFPSTEPWPHFPEEWPEEVPWPENPPEDWPDLPWPETPEEWPEEIPWPETPPEDWPEEVPWPETPEEWPEEIPWPETPPEWWPEKLPWPASPDEWPEEVPWPVPWPEDWPEEVPWPIPWPEELPYPIPWPWPQPTPEPDPNAEPGKIVDPGTQVQPYIDPVPWPYNPSDPSPEPRPDNPTQPTPKPNPIIDPSQPEPIDPTPSPGPGSIPDPTQPEPPPSSGSPSDPQLPYVPLPFSSTTGLITVYHPSQATLLEFCNWLWVTWQDATIDKVWNNPFDGVITLFELYCTPTDVGAKNIRSGFLDSGIASPVISRYTEIDCGSLGIPEYYGNYLDYAPYSKAYVYLPFIGVVELNVDDIVGHGVNVTYKIDEYNGSCIAMITVAKVTEVNGEDVEYNNVFYQYSGNCAVELPIAGGSQAAIKAGMIEAAAWGIGSVVGGIMSGGSLGSIGANMAYGVASAVHSLVSAKSSVQHSGSFGSSYGALGAKKPFITIVRPKQLQIANYNELYGYQAHKAVRIGSCSGYLRCREVHVISPTASDSEKNRIEELLKTGVYVTE